MRLLTWVIPICLIIIAASGLRAQEVVLTAGGEAYGEEGSASYSIGQVFYQHYSGASGQVAEGIQQPYEVFTVTGLKPGTGLSLKVYPNPASDELRIQADGVRFGELTARLFDLQGRLLEDRVFTNSEMSMMLGAYPSGAYLLRVSRLGEEVSVFKVLKK